MTKDQNGNVVRRNLCKVREIDTGATGYAVNVWFGGFHGPATNIRRPVYSTRVAAINADISDDFNNSPDLLAFDIIAGGTWDEAT